jgi:urease accessory protein
MTAESRGTPGLYRLLAWLSPSFPIGAFSYSHGLEAVVADGTVHDRTSIEAWVAAAVARGSGRIDADILCAAHRAASAGDGAGLEAANRQSLAFRATAELALESAQQGDAFRQTCRAAWPDASIEAWRENPHPNSPPQAGEGRVGAALGATTCHSAAFGAAAASAGIALEDALLGYLQAFAANLVSAGIRLGVVGQTDGQRILAALEPAVAAAAAAAMTRGPDDFGAATFAADLASMAHETQYTRLFRS